jgi:DNA topoisomerase-2
LKTKTAPKKRPKPDSDDEISLGDGNSRQDGSDLSNTPPSAKKQKKDPALKKGPAPKKLAGNPLQVVENESMAIDKPAASKAKAQTATELYQRLTQLEHIIKRPDTYIGSVERTDEQMWVFNSETEQMESRKVSFVPGLYKIFDEILVNAADNKQNDPSMKFIKVTIDREKGEISIENDGRGIPIEIHEVIQARPWKVSWY